MHSGGSKKKTVSFLQRNLCSHWLERMSQFGINCMNSAAKAPQLLITNLKMQNSIVKLLALIIIVFK